MTKRELTFQKSKDELAKILEEEQAKHRPVPIQNRKIYQGGTTTTRVTEAQFKLMVTEAAAVVATK